MTISALLPPIPPTGLARGQTFRLDDGAGRPPRILMIEDDHTIATMYRCQLQADGFEVRLATDGAYGLHLAQADPPDLVLLDVRISKLDGIEVLKTMRTDPRLVAPPVLILSNYSNGAMVREGLALGAREYLVKSQTTHSELAEKIRSHLPHPAESCSGSGGTRLRWRRRAFSRRRQPVQG
ncbi:MAG TPA: response regulator [Candidatus Dormibacteraeota bacterium]|nr:response regulator [Candidatus Dormibacteraeota bacterium]